MQKRNPTVILFPALLALVLVACRPAPPQLLEIRQAGGLDGADKTLTIRGDGEASLVCNGGSPVTFRLDTETLSEIDALTRQDLSAYTFGPGVDLIEYELTIRGKRQVTTDPGHPLVEKTAQLMLRCGG